LDPVGYEDDWYLAVLMAAVDPVKQDHHHTIATATFFFTRTCFYFTILFVIFKVQSITPVAKTTSEGSC